MQTADLSPPLVLELLKYLAENITQAVCADLLRDCLVRCEDIGLEVIAHTHDEIIIQQCSEDDESKLKVVMESNPSWASGIPLVAETNSGKRYFK